MDDFSTETRGYMSAVLSALALSMTGICIRYLTDGHGLEPLVLAFWRNLFLTAVLGLILECAYPILIEVRRSDLALLAGLGLVLALFNYLWTTSVAVNGAAVATFLVYSSVPFTALLGRVLLREPLGPGMVGAIGLALAGCLLVSGATTGAAARIGLPALLLGLGSGLCFAVYSLAGRLIRSRGLSAWTIMFYSFGFAALLLFTANTGAVALSGGSGDLSGSFFALGSSLSGWGVLFFLAIGPTLIGFGLYNISLGYLPSGVVNLISTAEPPLTALLAFLLLGEVLASDQILGAGLILGGVLLLRLGRRLRWARRRVPAGPVEGGCRQESGI